MCLTSSRWRRSATCCGRRHPETINPAALTLFAIFHPSHHTPWSPWAAFRLDPSRPSYGDQSSGCLPRPDGFSAPVGSVYYSQAALRRPLAGAYHGQTAFRRPLVADPGSTHTISFVRRSPDPDGVELPLDSQPTGSAIFLR